MPFDRQRVNQIFDDAVELTEPERTRFLERECAGERELRAEVESLLASDAAASEFIEEPILSIPPELFPDTTTDLAGKQIGPYRILREIGRGGLGVVYLAQRADDAYRKEVAIKVIRRGLDTEDILGRFRNERQILAQLEHPHIARLLDGGTSEDGLPFFVMEYVSGQSLIDYCDTQRLSVRARLGLFRKICAAVTYAHQNLVIHRDLKPSNILVTAESEPKLLDFGIARLLTAEDEDLTSTAPAGRVLTPAYASPEQIRGDRITTASDIYSLGVLLYEMLSGQKPYRLKNATSEEVARAITEEQPERPSTALLNARVTLHDSRILKGDLDNIVLMALRKEPERRYTSAAVLAEDIRRCLEGRTVVAHQDTFRYRATKFVRRNKSGVLAALLILLAILGGLVATLWEAHVAQAQRTKAERRFSDVRQLANSYLFDVYPEIENLQGSLKARETILKNALKYLDILAQESQGDLDLQGELATAYEKVGDVQGALNNSSLGDVKSGLETYGKAQVLRAAILSASPEDLEAKKQLANNLYVTARTYWNNNQTPEAESAFAKAIHLQRELIAANPALPVPRDKLAVMLIDYAAIPAFNSQSRETLALCNEALGLIEHLRQEDPSNPAFKKTEARLLRMLSKPKTALADYAGGLKALQAALSLSKEVARQFPEDFRAQRAVWLTETMTCELFIDQGNGGQAVNIGQRTIDFPKRALAKEPDNGVVAYDLAISYFNLARSWRLAGNPRETLRNATAAIEVMSKLSAKTPEDADYKRNLAIYETEAARAQIALGQFDEALIALQDAEKLLEPIVAANPKSATTQGDLGMTYRLRAQALHQKGDHGQAAELVNKAITIVRRLKEQNSLRNSEKGELAELEKEKSLYER